MGDVGVPGVEDVAGLSNWLAENDLPGGGQKLTVDLIAGGRSNLTTWWMPGPPASRERPRSRPRCAWSCAARHLGMCCPPRTT